MQSSIFVHTHKVDAVQVVQRRGESMSAAAKLGKAHGMLSVIGLDDKTMEEVCSKVRAAGGVDVVCQIANYLFPTGRVVSGHKSALDEATPHPTFPDQFCALIPDMGCDSVRRLMSPCSKPFAAVYSFGDPESMGLPSEWPWHCSLRKAAQYEPYHHGLSGGLSLCESVSH